MKFFFLFDLVIESNVDGISCEYILECMIYYLIVNFIICFKYFFNFFLFIFN